MYSGINTAYCSHKYICAFKVYILSVTSLFNIAFNTQSLCQMSAF